MRSNNNNNFQHQHQSCFQPLEDDNFFNNPILSPMGYEGANFEHDFHFDPIDELLIDQQKIYRTESNQTNTFFDLYNKEFDKRSDKDTQVGLSDFNDVKISEEIDLPQKNLQDDQVIFEFEYEQPEIVVHPPFYVQVTPTVMQIDQPAISSTNNLVQRVRKHAIRKQKKPKPTNKKALMEQKSKADRNVKSNFAANLKKFLQFKIQTSQLKNNLNSDIELLNLEQLLEFMERNEGNLRSYEGWQQLFQDPIMGLAFRKLSQQYFGGSYSATYIVNSRLKKEYRPNYFKQRQLFLQGAMNPAIFDRRRELIEEFSESDSYSQH